MADLGLLISEFAARRKVDGLTPDAKGEYRIGFDEDLEVLCFERFGMAHLISSVERLPEEPDAAFERMRPLLKQTLMRMKHSDVAPAISEDGEAVLFTRFETQNMNVVQFEDKVEGYLNTVEEYRLAIAQGARSRSVPLAAAIFRP